MARDDFGNALAERKKEEEDKLESDGFGNAPARRVRKAEKSTTSIPVFKVCTGCQQHFTFNTKAELSV